jgi:outer membrane protein TolC
MNKINSHRPYQRGPFPGRITYFSRFIYFVFLAAFFNISPLNLPAQNNPGNPDRNQFQNAPADSFMLRLPPLETLIDSAVARAPVMKGQQINIEKGELNIRKSRYSWAKDIITGGVNVNYGLFDNLIISKDLGLDQLNTKANQQTRYTLGLALKLPITNFFDKYDLKMARLTLEQTEIEKQVMIQNIREEVYNRYNYLIGAYQKYAILLEDFDGYQILLDNAEKNFLSNRISIEEYTAVRMSNSKAKTELNDARNEFIKARWMLEELTGIPIR